MIDPLTDFQTPGVLATPAWTRRAWLAATAVPTIFATSRTRRKVRVLRRVAQHHAGIPEAGICTLSEVVDDGDALVQTAVDAATQAGAQYADARLTRMVWQHHHFGGSSVVDDEEVGIGVRALVDGYWGFASCPSADQSAVNGLAKTAVAQAKANAQGAPPRPIDLGTIPVAVGHWATPLRIDPFRVPLEEKAAFMRYWDAYSEKVAKESRYAVRGIDNVRSYIQFARQERIVATSQGGRFTQTVYESGGNIISGPISKPTDSFGQQMQAVLSGEGPTLPIDGIETAGRGWELFLDAKIPEQIETWPARAAARVVIPSRQALIGRYTVVCDGATMAALLAATVGVATQLDRALGFEANASGTSFLDDPLTMAGTFKVASPIVTITANRSAPAQLATVKWDDEGVVPVDTTLVKDGILHDFQTTREQAIWLAPYYTKNGQPVRSKGYAAAESALTTTLQHMPNLSLEPSATTASLDDLVSNVKDGVLIEGGTIFQIDAQARNGLLFSDRLRQIKNGRLGAFLTNGAIQFNTLDLWRNIITVGGPSTQQVVSFSQYPWVSQEFWNNRKSVKGEPLQAASHSVQAAAATIANQPLIDPERKA